MFENITLEYITETKENGYFERKSSAIKPDHLVKQIIAFANANGGVIVVGVEDKGEITGFARSKYTVDEYINAIRQNCIPVPKFEYKTIVINEETKDFILLIGVESESGSIISDRSDKVYLRVKDSSRELSHREITSLEYDRGFRLYEDKVIEEATIDDLDLLIIENYKERMNVLHKDNIEVLTARGLYKNNKLTNAAILLFGKNPTQFLPNARIKFIRYDGSQSKTGSRLNIVKEQSFDSAIPKLIPEITDFIKTQLREFQKLGDNGQFQIIPEYPEFAWFEGIVNAVTHRDYGFTG
ncbi:AlbA family DNA-binding domain-containing protein, partial [Veillonella ratti]|uniref:AlbA family DNA-binding domain-containing protein n=1 Tax=Veillonella ratti TaxID=103892 RepID=UPI0019CFBB0F